MSNDASSLPLPAETDRIAEILLSDGKWYEVGDFSISNGAVFWGGNKDIRFSGDWFSAQVLDRSEEHEDGKGVTDYFFTLSGPVSSIVAYRTNYQAYRYTD